MLVHDMCETAAEAVFDIGVANRAAIAEHVARPSACASYREVTMIANSLILNAWYAAGLASEFPVGELQGHIIGGKPIVMWRGADGEVVAFDDRCVHKRMPLSAGRLLDNGLLECAYHGLCYNTEGTCVKIPSQPDGPIPARARLRPYSVIEQEGLVWLWPGDPVKIGNCRPPRTPGNRQRRLGYGQLRGDSGERELPPRNREPSRYHALLSVACRQYRRRGKQPDSRRRSKRISSTAIIRSNR